MSLWKGDPGPNGHWLLEMRYGEEGADPEPGQEGASAALLDPRSSGSAEVADDRSSEPIPSTSTGVKVEYDQSADQVNFPL